MYRDPANLTHFSLETFVIPMGTELSIYAPSLHIFVLLCVYSLGGLEGGLAFLPLPPPLGEESLLSRCTSMRGNYFRPYLSARVRGPEVQHLNETRPTIFHF